MGIDTGPSTAEISQALSYYGLLKYVQLPESQYDEENSDLDEIYLAGGIQFNTRFSPYLEFGVDIFDPGGQIFDRFGEGSEILINEIFNNNLGDCRDDDSCTNIQFERYFKAGAKASIQQNIIPGYL